MISTKPSSLIQIFYSNLDLKMKGIYHLPENSKKNCKRAKVKEQCFKISWNKLKSG